MVAHPQTELGVYSTGKWPQDLLDTAVNRPSTEFTIADWAWYQNSSSFCERYTLPPTTFSRTLYCKHFSSRYCQLILHMLLTSKRTMQIRSFSIRNPDARTIRIGAMWWESLAAHRPSGVGTWESDNHEDYNSTTTNSFLASIFCAHHLPARSLATTGLLRWR